MIYVTGRDLTYEQLKTDLWLDDFLLKSPEVSARCKGITAVCKLDVDNGFAYKKAILRPTRDTAYPPMSDFSGFRSALWYAKPSQKELKDSGWLFVVPTGLEQEARRYLSEDGLECELYDMP